MFQFQRVKFTNTMSGIIFGFLLGTSALSWALTPSLPLVINGQTGVTVSGLLIKNPGGYGIQIINSHTITIEGCEIDSCQDEGIYVSGSSNVTIRGNRFVKVKTGVYALQSQAVNVSGNQFLNMQGPFPRGQFVQFDKVTGSGNRITDNTGENIMGASYPEDAINLYMSAGTVADPIQVTGNLIRGGGPSTSGGGIMTGDDGGSYVLVQNNRLVDPGQYGIAIASGDHIRILDNLVYARQQSFTNVGIYVWNQYAPACNSHEVRGNQVNWTNQHGVKNPGWDSDNCGPVAGWDDNNWEATINASILPVDLFGTTAVPVISPNGGIFFDSVEVSISCATSGATIRYTTNGSDPTSTSPHYTASFRLKSTTTVKACALKTGLTDSPVAGATFTMAPSNGNLALGKPATSSSTDNPAHLAGLAVDRNATTRWSSAYSDTQWLQVDLQGTFSIASVVLNWEAAYGKNYRIELSDNGTSWTTAYIKTGGTGGVETLVLTGNPSGRYVRMYGTARSGIYGFSLWEFEVYGSVNTGMAAPYGAKHTQLFRVPGHGRPATRLYNLQGRLMSAGVEMPNGIYLLEHDGRPLEKIFLSK